MRQKTVSTTEEGINKEEQVHPYHKRLTLTNFTAFAEQTFEFVPGINVLIGENGVGKTHVMKALYALQMAMHLRISRYNASPMTILREIYNVNDAPIYLHAQSEPATIRGEFNNTQWAFNFKSDGDLGFNTTTHDPTRPIFIPAIEMMAHTRNMLGIMRGYADFDRTCFDFLELVTAIPSGRSTPSPSTLLKPLKALVPGEVQYAEEEGRFYLTEGEKRLPFALVAEGARKVAALSRLIEGGWLKPGTVLFWDEPEVNINPKWMDEIIETLVLLAKSGVQIFLATHSYVVLKELDLILREQKGKKSTPVTARFFSLYREDGTSKAVWGDDFATLEPNPILDHYDAMMARDWRLRDEGK